MVDCSVCASVFTAGASSACEVDSATFAGSTDSAVDFAGAAADSVVVGASCSTTAVDGVATEDGVAGAAGVTPADSTPTVVSVALGRVSSFVAVDGA